MKYDNTDKTAFIAIMALTVLTGVVCYFVFAAVSPVPGVVNSIYGVELPAQSSASASAGNSAAASGPVDESKFTKKVTIDILKGASTQGNPAYGPTPAAATSDALVTWVNTDNVPHTATSGTGPDDPNSGKLFDSSIITPNAKYSVPASKLGKGDIPFYCTVHPYMHGKITVS
ncbi:MAG: cupredoxin domain-containing protein [Candidatus Nitrosocosmicus sp.]